MDFISGVGWEGPGSRRRPRQHAKRPGPRTSRGYVLWCVCVATVKKLPVINVYTCTHVTKWLLTDTCKGIKPPEMMGPVAAPSPAAPLTGPRRAALCSWAQLRGRDLPRPRRRHTNVGTGRRAQRGQGSLPATS